MDVLNRPTLMEIKERLGSLKCGLEERNFLLSRDVAGGVPQGVLCEITGTARTAWMMDLLIQNPTLTVFWAEQKLTVFPTAFQQRGVDLSRVLIAETGEKLFQTLRKALKSKLFDCVVLPGVIDEIKLLKALQLFARESHAAVFLLSKLPQSAWAIPFQLRAQWDAQGQRYEVEVIKSKFTRSGNA